MKIKILILVLLLSSCIKEIPFPDKELNSKLVVGCLFGADSLFNVYNRMNSYFVYLSKDYYGKYHFYKFTMFPIIPSISYSFVF